MEFSQQKDLHRAKDLGHFEGSSYYGEYVRWEKFDVQHESKATDNVPTEDRQALTSNSADTFM